MTDDRKGRFLLACSDAGGTVPPLLGLAGRLTARGHEVLVLGDPTIADSARAAGCSFTAWPTAPSFASVDEQTAWIKDLEERKPLDQLRYARDEIVCGPARRFAGDVVATVRRSPVDVVLADAVGLGALIGAEAIGRPAVALMPNVYLRLAPDRPMLGTGWRPASGPVGRARDRLLHAAVSRVWARGLPEVNDARAVHGLPPVADTNQILDRCARVLVLTSPTFDFVPPDLPTNVRYVGPQLDDPAWAEVDDWRPAGAGPLVLVAMSSVYQDQAEILGMVTRALGRLPVRALVTTGRAVDPRDIPAPENVRVVRAAPHGQVLAETAAVVTHAGHGTVLKSLAAGVPLVCLPQGRDQKDNTTRVLRLGAGLRVSRPSEERIAAAVRTVVEDPTYATAAQRVAQALSAEAAARRDAAVEECESLLHMSLRRHRPEPGAGLTGS